MGVEREVVVGGVEFVFAAVQKGWTAEKKQKKRDIKSIIKNNICQK